MKNRFVTILSFVVTFAAAVTASAGEGRALDRHSPAGTVYTMSNAVSGNAILLFDRCRAGADRVHS